ncbi:hypothetical protein BY458DRAFT_506153 [Sporodiniella umbellata]|nr:hypothetical protein BY458DRAFT_506153 [Sporodiniella umbellata]
MLNKVYACFLLLDLCIEMHAFSTCSKLSGCVSISEFIRHLLKQLQVLNCAESIFLSKHILRACLLSVVVY